jgi:hypothetical protein
MKSRNLNIRQLSSHLMPSWTFYVIIGLGAFLRLIVLKSDPPLDLARGQSLWTDPWQYVFFARNLINFGRMDCFAPSDLIFFKYSFISFLSIPIFYLLRPGYWQSNFVSSIISIATITIFGLTIKKSVNNFAGIIASIFASTSYVFVMHNRVPYLENASIFFLSISGMIFILKYENRYYLGLSGFFLACSLLIGKTLGVMVIPAFAISAFFLERRQAHFLKKYFTKLLWFFGGSLTFTLFAMAFLYLPNYDASREYLLQNVVNYYGFPNGLRSLGGFIRGIYTLDLINFENRFFDRLPIVTICAVLFLYIMHLNISKNEEKRAIILFASWFVCGYIFLSPWNYRPIRYEMYLVLPMIALAAFFLNDMVLGSLEVSLRKIAVGIMLMSIVSFHIYFNYSHAGRVGYLPFWQIFGYSLIIGISISISLILILRGVNNFRPVFRVFGALLIVLISLTLNAIQFINWSHKLTYAIEYANRNVRSELSNNAIIIGPYAQTLTLETLNMAEIFYFGAYPKNESLFTKVPATHVTYEMGARGERSGNEAKFAEYYNKAYVGSKQIDSYLIGRYYVNIFNITEGSDNTLANCYKMTDFEKGMEYYNRNILDSALVYLNEAETTGNVGRASLYKGNIYYKEGNYKLANLEYAKGLADDCYDPKFWALYSITCTRIGDYLMAEGAKEKAMKYAPFPGFFYNINF